MANGAPERMGAMTNSVDGDVRGKVATWIPRHVHDGDLIEGAFRFFFNREMEDDLVLNLATDDPAPGSSRTVHAKKGGKWTDR